MLDLVNLLANNDLTRAEKILIILATFEEEIRPLAIKEKAITNGLRESAKWNVPGILASLKKKRFATNLPNGWIITNEGKAKLVELGIVSHQPTRSLKPMLRDYANKISSEQVREFVEEAISALELNLWRSAIVLSWVGAVAILYDYVLHNCLNEFNNEAKKRFPKWKSAKTADDLSKMSENHFLEIIASIGLLGKNVKGELLHCLDTRNACGHPNSYTIGVNKVAAHIEVLILNVYSKFT